MQKKSLNGERELVFHSVEVLWKKEAVALRNLSATPVELRLKINRTRSFPNIKFPKEFPLKEGASISRFCSSWLLLKVPFPLFFLLHIICQLFQPLHFPLFCAAAQIHFCFSNKYLRSLKLCFPSSDSFVFAFNTMFLQFSKFKSPPVLKNFQKLQVDLFFD